MTSASTRCPACHNNAWTEIAPDDRSFSLSRCTRCGCYRIQANAAAPEELYRDYYDADGAKRLSGIFDAIWQNRRHRKAALILEKSPKGAHVLDIGCERGELLNVLKQHGCSVAGTQMSQAAANFAQKQFGIFVFVGELSDAPFGLGTFDMVLMINVLEHLPDPEAYVERVAALLKPGGTFWLEVPNAASFTARVTGKRWLHHDPDHHLWAFSPSNIGPMVERHGFIVEHANHVTWEHGPIGALQSWLNFLPGPRNVIFEIVQKGLSKKPGRLALQLVHAAIGAALLPFAFMTAALEGASGNGQVMLLRLRRP